MSDTIKIDRCNGENWPTYKIQLQAILMDQGTWEVIDGTHPCNSVIMKIDDKALDKEPKEITDYRTLLRKAYAKIVSTLSPKIIPNIEHLKHPKLIWDYLQSKYEQKSVINKVYLIKELFQTKMDESTKPEEHIAKMERLSNQLEALSLGFKEEVLAIALLNSLPQSYSQFRTAMEVGNMDKQLTFDQVKLGIINEALRQKKEHTEDTTALFSKPKFDKRFCTHCKKKGHTNAKCFKLNPTLKREKANKATTEDAKLSDMVLVAHSQSLIASNQKEWIVDSGASAHMTPVFEYIRNFEKFSNPVPVSLGDKSTVDAIGKGDVFFYMKLNEGTRRVILKDVLYVPHMKFNLFSVPTVVAKGFTVGFQGNSFEISKNGEIIALGTNTASHTTLNCEVFVESKSAKIATISVEEGHQRLGHISYERVIATSKLVEGLNIDTKTIPDHPICEACIQGKHTRTPLSREPASRTNQRLGRIHSDICGPMSVPTFGGRRYFAVFVDDKTRLGVVSFLNQKSDYPTHFANFRTGIELQTNEKVKILRSDNGSEFTSKQFVDYCAKNGIKQELTAPHTPSQDGVAERRIRTLVEIARTILIAAKLPISFWAEAVNYANWIINRSATKSVEGTTPFEAFYQKKPDLSIIHTFGCKAWVYNHLHHTKFDSKSQLCIYVGPTDNPGTHKLYNPVTKRFITSRDVKFEETPYNVKSTTSKIPEEATDPESEVVIFPLSEENPVEKFNFPIVDDVEEPNDDVEEPNDEISTEPEPELRKSSRKSNPTPKFVPNSNIQPVVRVAAIPQEPTTFKQATTGPNAAEWKDAAYKEFSSLQKMQTWILVPKPANHNIVSCKWVWKIKTKADGSIERFKARLVARGFTQQQGIDYDETFAPVARVSSIRMLLSIAVTEKLKIFQMDVDTAYLYGKLDEDIYMSQPEGFVDPNYPNHVCKLLRSLYGLKQAAKVWNQTLHIFLLENGFLQSTADPCIYLYSDPKGKIILAVYVDDLLIICTTEDQRNFVKNLLSKKFNMKDLGEAHYILGIQLIRSSDGSIVLSQSTYLSNMLEQFGMSDCKTIATPTCGGDTTIAANSEPVDSSLYRQAVGKLNYAAVCTRPDLAFAVSLSSRYMANPTSQNWQLIKRIFRYIKGTLDFGLKIGHTTQHNSKLLGYSDADWAGDTLNRKSTTGYVFFLFGSLVSWNSKKQPTVALSSTESEYMALSEITKEAIWIRKFLSSLGYNLDTPAIIMEDNQGAIELAKNPVHHARTKHIDIRHHFVREKLLTSEIDLIYVPTNEQIADALTKPLVRDKFEKLCRQMGLIPTKRT